MKVVGLKISDEWFNALEEYTQRKGISKQKWLYSKLEEHFFLIEQLTKVNKAIEDNK